MPPGIDNYLQQSYDVVNNVRNNGNLRGWNDAWSNFMVNHALSQYEFAQNRQMAEEEYQRNLELWNLMNEYNSPANQMKRFSEAGLNPNLIYSQGSNGNASGQPSYSAPSYQARQVNFSPQKEAQDRFNQKLGAVLDIVGGVNNVIQNIGQMYNTSLDMQLKQNQVYQSNFDTAVMRYAFPGAGYSRKDIGPYQSMTLDQINPLSKNFDPVMYLSYQRLGALPQFYNQSLTADQQREYLNFKSKYQDYYNKNVLPKFKEYQEGKVSLQQFEIDLQEYAKQSREMTPAWLKGILDPLFGYLGPLIEYAFKYYMNH